MNAGILDKEAREQFTFPAQYMFKDVPDYGEVDDPVAVLLAEMDRFNIIVGMLNVSTNPVAREAVAQHPDRFVASFNVDPNEGMEAVRKLDAAVRDLDVRSAQCFPAGLLPQVPINDKKMYPLYAKCVELDIPIFVNAGVPGPRVPMACQDVALHRQGVLVLPRAQVRDAPRRRAVDRAGDEADAQVAEPLLLHVARSHRSTTPRTSCTSPTHAAPTRCSTPATSRWA